MQFYFDCGLPRSGSTLLTAILNQNPDIYAGVISPVLELMEDADFILTKEPAITFPKPYIFNSIIKSNIINYYSDKVEPIIIDKSRMWPRYIDLIKKYITPNPKLICTVRHPLETLASFITLIHENKGVSYVDKALTEFGYEINDDNRCHILMEPDGIITKAIKALEYAYKNNQSHHVHIIQYDDLVSKPTEVMNQLHEFLELDQFDYSFNNIKAIEREDDEHYGIPKMHEVRQEIKKISKPYTEVLSKQVIEQYKEWDPILPLKLLEAV